MKKLGQKVKEKAAACIDRKRSPAQLPEPPSTEAQATGVQNSGVQNTEGQATETQSNTPATPRSELAWNDLISHRIEEAIREGAFDNLRGKGKPLSFDRNPFVPADQQMANDLLKNNNLAPHWISERTAMLGVIEQFRLRFHSTARRFQQSWQRTTDAQARHQLNERWQQQVAAWTEEIKTLNGRITALNLQQPIARLEIFKVILDEELTRAGMKRTLE
ncbi:MAG: DUF1992 domain-containing protein [Caldilineaceae bacterium]